MDKSVRTEQYAADLAEEVLDRFGKISEEAKKVLETDNRIGFEAFADVNTMTSPGLTRSVNKIETDKREAHQKLASEPAIARVAVEDDTGKQSTYYFCRADQGMPNLKVVSYKAAIGRVASLPVGEEFKLPNGTVIEVLERALFRPEQHASGWDSRDSVVETEHYGPVTIESLRALISEVAGEEQVDDILGRLLAEDGLKANIIDGVRRSVITKMGLRDQPILDQYQDEIFRLPLDKRLLLLGPPGTGKTTTLIRRLGQKLDTAYLEEGEQILVANLSSVQGLSHTHSWLMFTPTELLKQYLKEAFAREGIPAPDSQISTWSDYRRELARAALGILRTTSGGGVFVMKDAIQSMGPDAAKEPIQWFEDFETSQRAAFLDDLRHSAKGLCEAQVAAAQDLGKRISDILERATTENLPATFSALAAEAGKVHKLVTKLKESSDQKIKGALNLQLNRNKTFLNELATFIDTLQQAQVSDVDEQDELDADEEEDSGAPRTAIQVALNAYMQAVRAQARAAVTKRAVSKSSRNGKILEWLGDRTLADGDRLEVGASVVLQASARRFVNPVKRYVGDIPKRYRSFRRQRQQEGRWYAKEGFEHRDIHPLEVDGVVLAVLRASGDLLSRQSVQRDIDERAWSSLKPYLELYRNQILVDEATDFSPIQLACMAALAHPRLRSFFACGDFNQRLTTWGARSTDELKWVFPDIDIKEVTVSYRQSEQLNELARAIIHAVGGTDQAVTLPNHAENRGVMPALLESTKDRAVVVRWLAERIREIERFLKQMPSIAVFVNAEDEVEAVAAALADELVEHNIPVVACREGQAVGQESNVRVFDIQHIKGLEFEAVFFIAIDRLAALHPELFDKYLYVGTTRAATYLGVTCEDALPPAIEGLRPLFGQNWSAPGSGAPESA